MHSYLNAKHKNEVGDGNVLEHFKKMKNLIAVNDGIRKFSPRTTTCHDQQAPFWENEQTYLSLTHQDHHISHIADGFIHMVVELMLQYTYGTVNRTYGETTTTIPLDPKLTPTIQVKYLLEVIESGISSNVD
jgi:hypothetical protein